MHKRSFLLLLTAIFAIVAGCSRLDTERYSIDKKNLTIGNESYTIVSITEDKMTWKKVGEGDAYSHFRKK